MEKYREYFHQQAVKRPSKCWGRSAVRKAIAEAIGVDKSTLYKKGKRSGGKLHTYLRRQGRKYAKGDSKNAGRGFIPNRVDIDERPTLGYVTPNEKFRQFIYMNSVAVAS